MNTMGVDEPVEVASGEPGSTKSMTISHLVTNLALICLYK